jgi:hypothetical protein
MSDKRQVDKPEWWPKNPYFEDAMVSVKNDTDYIQAIPDPNLRTAISWYLGNRMWELASEATWEALVENCPELIETL